MQFSKAESLVQNGISHFVRKYSANILAVTIQNFSDIRIKQFHTPISFKIQINSKIFRNNNWNYFIQRVLAKHLYVPSHTIGSKAYW